MSARFATSMSPAKLTSISTYSTSVNPSSRNNSSARYSGAKQIAGTFTSRIFVISGGGSATAVRGRPNNDAAPKADVERGTCDG
jgi:hypothetical protein